MAKKGKQIYCSSKCRGAARKTGHYITCVICHKEVYKQAQHLGVAKCCSPKCAGELGRRIKYGEKEKA